MAACGNFNQAPAEDCEDCVQVVKTHKNVQVPCSRNTFRQYTVRVPRQVTERVARNVQFTEMENRTRQVPYTVNRPEERVRMESRSFPVPVQKTNTRMVPVTRKVPKTIYVDVTTQVPQQYTTTVMECRTKQVPVKYTVNVPEQRTRTETYQVPVQRSKTVYDNVTKTVYDTQTRTQCVPVTKMVTKRVPVFNVVARPAAPCPPGMDCGQGDDNMAFNANASGSVWGGSQAGGYGFNVRGSTAYRSEFQSLDKNGDGRIDFKEYAAARQGAAAAAGGAAAGGSVAAAGGQGFNAGAAAAGGQGFNAGAAAAGGQGFHAGAAAAGGQGFNAGAASGGASAAAGCNQPCAGKQ